MEQNPYSPPESKLEKSDVLVLRACFSTLNFWRKLYLVLSWTINILLAAGVTVAITKSDMSNIPIAIGLAVYFLGIAYWTHWAIVKRNVGHITTLAILSLVPGGNIIGCLIMFSIRGVTVNELKRFNLKDA